MADRSELPTPANIPPFEMRPDGVRDFMSGAIRTIVTNARALRNMSDNPQVREYTWEQRRKTNAAEEAGLLTVADAFDAAAPRRDADSEEGWRGYVKKHVEAALNPDGE